MITNPVKIFIALPTMNELENMEDFIHCCSDQSYKNFKLIVCVNQPDNWWQIPEKVSICINNTETLNYLSGISEIEIEVIDKCSAGNGWKGKDFGVGWARKIVMDHISSQADNHDLLISLDADTRFHPGYFQSVVDSFLQNQDAVALSVPYYHNLTGDEEKDRAILHYEIYMRYYAINLWRTENYYRFTAVGSAIALPVRAYRAIGGITPHKSGEDFYFIQKLRKYGRVLTWNREKVFPEARYSDRVFFGTGPAMIKGRLGEWYSYPVYPYEYFDEVKKTTNLFPLLFKSDIQTPMDEFLQEKFSRQNIWQPLRENCRTEQMFVKACHHKIDALRILQFLKWRHSKHINSDEENLLHWFQVFYQGEAERLNFNPENFSLSTSPVEELDNLRNVLVEIEETLQRTNHNLHSKSQQVKYQTL